MPNPTCRIPGCVNGPGAHLPWDTCRPPVTDITLVADFLPREDRAHFASCACCQRSANDIACGERRLLACEAALAAKEAEAARVFEVLTKREATLRLIANDGCGCGLANGETCREQHPGHDDEWCWSCIASAALDGSARP